MEGHVRNSVHFTQFRGKKAWGTVGIEVVEKKREFGEQIIFKERR